jgi:hypothetical protein
MNGAVATIRNELTSAFNRVFDVFTVREDVLYYQPSNGGWSMYQVLEHVVLANHFLLCIVNKQADRAMQLAKVVGRENETQTYMLDANKLKKMELTGSYVWVPQRYTEPAGDMPLLQIKMSLHDHMNQSLELLENDKVLEAIARTYEAGKLDALHYLYFMIQHMRRHLHQAQRLKQEFNQFQKQSLHTVGSRIAKTICLN